MPVPPLPPAGPGDPVEWVKGVAVMERTPPLAPPPTPKSKPARPAVRPSTHPLVTAWRGFLEEATPTEAGYMMPRKKNVLDAFVTKAAMRAAAEALNAIFIELEMRRHKVQLSADHYGHQRPPVDVAMREIRDRYERRPNDWQPGRPTMAYVRDAEVGLTLFELTENVRVRRTGADRYVRIKDLPATRRYAPQAPGEEDLTRDMPTGRFVLRAYSPLHDTDWRHEWTEMQPGEFAGMTNAIADLLEEAAPVIVQQAKDAKQREKERQIQAAKELRRLKAQQRAEARQRAAGGEEEAARHRGSVERRLRARGVLHGTLTPGRRARRRGTRGTRGTDHSRPATNGWPGRNRTVPTVGHSRRSRY
jgi:hypothetical protein